MVRAKRFQDDSASGLITVAICDWQEQVPGLTDSIFTAEDAEDAEVTFHGNAEGNIVGPARGC